MEKLFLNIFFVVVMIFPLNSIGGPAYGTARQHSQKIESLSVEGNRLADKGNIVKPQKNLPKHCNCYLNQSKNGKHVHGC